MATKKKQNKSVELKLQGVHLISHEMNKLSKPLPEDPVFQFTVNIHISVIKGERILAFGVETIIFSEDKETNYSRSMVGVEFQFMSFDGIFDEKKGKLNLDDMVYFNLVSISLSTARGVLFDLNRGTYLHKAYLPLLDPRKFALDKEQS